MGGIISARSRKNTVNDTRIEMLNDIYEREIRNLLAARPDAAAGLGLSDDNIKFIEDPV